jgi:hypothetical protein
MTDFPRKPHRRVANRNGRHPICVASRESQRRARCGPGGAAPVVAALLVLCSASSLVAETAPFALAAVEATGDALALRFPGDVSCYYVIEASPELEPAHWAVAAMLLGVAEPMRWEAPAGGAARRAFRVRRRLRSAPGDYDMDGLDDVAELLRGTNPLAADSDGDGLSDAWEVAHLLDPLDDGSVDPGQHPDADPDADGLSIRVEAALGLDPFGPDLALPVSATLETKSYTAVRRKFQEMPAFREDPDAPAPVPPVYYLRAAVEGALREARDLDLPGYEEYRLWSRSGAITVDPRTMMPSGTYTATYHIDENDPNPSYGIDATYTFHYVWTDGVPELTITAEGTIGDTPAPTPEGTIRCAPWVGDAAMNRDIGITQPFARKYLGDGSITPEQIRYAYDNTDPAGAWSDHLQGSAALSEEFTTELLEALTEEALEQMPSFEGPWAQLDWETGKTRVWPWAYCGDIVTLDQGGDSGRRELELPNQTALTLRRAKFRFRVHDTIADALHVLRWEERFRPDPPGMTMEDPVHRTVYFLGTGGPVLIGNPADSRDTNLYTALFGPAQADDFTIDPPGPARGNGDVVVSLLEDELPVHPLVDLDLDANGDGAITESDDPLETRPGGLVGVREPGSRNADAPLIPIRLRVTPAPGTPGTAELRIHASPFHIRLWNSPERLTQPASLHWDLAAGDILPDTLYVEALDASDFPADIALRLLYHPPNGDPPIEDRVALTALHCDLAADINLDGRFDAIDDTMAAAPHGKLLRATPANDTHRERLQLTLYPAPPHGRLRLSLDNPSALAIFDQAGTQLLGPQAGELWESAVPTDHAVATPHTLFVQGLAPGQSTLTASFLNNAGGLLCRTSLTLTVLAVDLVPDWNRDLRIDDADRHQATAQNPFRFWINDDEDREGEDAGNEFDQPGSSHPDSEDRQVNTLRDLLDFHPVFLDLQHALATLQPEPYLYCLSLGDHPAEAKANFLYTDLSPATSGSYLTNIPTARAVADIGLIPLESFDALGVVLPIAFLHAIAAGNGILLVEYTQPTTQPLRLHIREPGGTPLLEVALPLSISSVEDMFTRKDLRGIVARDLESTAPDWTGSPQDLHTVSEPPNYPDALTNNKAFIFAHGYNNNLRAARGGHAEMFKRLFWSGSNARYYAVCWYGYQDQIHFNWLFGEGWACPNYQGNVINAFKTAPAFADFVSGIPKPTKVVAAHSLGNMLVSSAIQDHGLQVDKFFMLNAAVSSEAYSSTPEAVIPDMIHVDWDPFLPAPADTNNYDKLFAYNWHSLFDSADSRHTLTWNGRFANVAPVAYNFWSAGDETFFAHPHDITPGGWEDWKTPITGAHAWCLQEKRKGRAALLALGGSYIGGWGFNNYYQDATQPAIIPTDILKSEPFFKKGDADHIPDFHNLFDPAALDSAVDPLTHAALLATFIPAKQLGLGHTRKVQGLLNSRHFEMQYEFNNDAWHDNTDIHRPDARYWNHGDFKTVAMPYVYRLYKAFTNIESITEE